MRFALNLEHRDFYSKNGFVEFEHLLTLEQIETLQQAIDTTLATRLKITPSKLIQQSAAILFQAGFDLWRDHPLIKKALFKTTLSDIASQLFQAPLLRMGYDQYIDTRHGTATPLTGHQTIEAQSCAKPLLGALILRLSPATPHSVALIPSQIGSGIYVNPKTPLNWKELFAQSDLKLLILTYASPRALYYLEPNDPHTHSWKKLSYVFGDRLNDSVHPILYRG